MITSDGSIHRKLRDGVEQRARRADFRCKPHLDGKEADYDCNNKSVKIVG